MLFDRNKKLHFKPFEVDLKGDAQRRIVSKKGPLEIGVSIDNVIA